MSEHLEAMWSEFCSDLSVPEDHKTKWLQFVREAYSSGICYDIKYLEFKLQQLQNCKHALKLPHAVFLALLFQSIVYDTKSADNAEKCIEIFHKFANEAQLGKNPELVSKVADLIDLSVTNSTEEHKTPDLYGELDDHYFLDINMVIWATEWEKYSEFCGKTRKEYDFLNDTAYVSLRLKVLRSLLMIPNLFATKEFRSKFEEKARDNIKKEINSLN